MSADVTVQGQASLAGASAGKTALAAGDGKTLLGKWAFTGKDGAGVQWRGTLSIAKIEPNAFLSQTQTLASVASESERVTRVVLWLLGVFAVTSLALAAIGIYGVMSYAVRQRTREIGTRIALGATRTNILWLVLQQGALIAAVGTVVGLATGLATTRFLSSILYGVSGTDPLTLGVAVVLLVITIMLACYVPARRAASVDPAKTLAEQ